MVIMLNSSRKWALDFSLYVKHYRKKKKVKFVGV